MPYTLNLNPKLSAIGVSVLFGVCTGVSVRAHVKGHTLQALWNDEPV